MYSLNSLLTIMEKLRSKDGCPWDQKQTHKSLTPHLIEEAYEVLEAVEHEQPELLADELGDVLLQVVFHAQIGKEAGNFTIDDIIRAICEKLIRRHPHVFADTKVNSISDVMTNWEQIKQTEKLTEKRSSLLDGIPKQLPALMHAEKTQKKAAKIGFEWTTINGALKKVSEEIAEFEEAINSKDSSKIEEEFGDILFSLVNVGRYLKIEPESSIRKTTKKFTQRFKYIEQQAIKEGKNLEEMSLAEMDELWEEAKKHFTRNPHE